MWRRHWMLLLAFLAVGINGCGGSDEANTTGANAGQASAAQQAAGPAEAITVFLDAVRRGDDDRAAEMFTVMAREKASAMNIQVAPKGSDTASFTVGQIEEVAQDIVKVQSTWTDVDEQGSFRTDQMAWMLRREPVGWRVAGMAATVFQGEPPLLLDFENPEETLRKLELLRNEIQRRGDAESLQATQPRNPGDAVYR